jgi:hypothetical protein
MYGKSTEWINRYPICALVYRIAAEMMNYSVAEAKSLALARATFFAAAKQGWGSWAPKGHGKGASKSSYTKVRDLREAGADPNSQEELIFAGVGTHIVHVGNEIRAIFGGKLQTPEDYDRRVEHKLLVHGVGPYDKVVDYVVKKLEELNTYELNSTAVFKVYENLRDTVRQRSFIENDRVSAKTNELPSE